MPRHSAPPPPTWLRPRLVVAFVVAAAGLVTAVWLPTRNDSADAAERSRTLDSRRDPALSSFADDFSGRRGSTVDPAKWGLRTDAVGNGLQFTDSVRHARLDGAGNLVIVLRSGDRDDTFTSARLFTRQPLRGDAGHLEARIRTPEGEGLRPTFELVPAAQRTGALNLLAEPAGDDEFHTYAVDWTPGEVALTVDGRQVSRRTLEGVDTTQPFRLALSLAVGDDTTRADLPARMVVDSVAFTAADAPAPPSSKPPTSEPPTTEPTAAPTKTPPATTPPATTPPAATTPPTTTAPTKAPVVPTWAPFTDYVAGQPVKYKGVEYQVLETHTSLPGWEPTALPALFKKL